MPRHQPVPTEEQVRCRSYKCAVATTERETAHQIDVTVSVDIGYRRPAFHRDRPLERSVAVTEEQECRALSPPHTGSNENIRAAIVVHVCDRRERAVSD